MPPLIVDHVARCVSELPATAFGKVLPATDLSRVAAFRVLHQGREHDIWVHDDQRRPPEPGAYWLDDLISAACRRLFGLTRGHCRARTGAGILEFREVWPEPAAFRVVEKVPVTIEPGPRNVHELRDTVVVHAAALPGADVASVILASAGALCAGRFGPGSLAWEPHRPSHLRFKPGGASVPAEVRYWHTVVRPGGVPVQVVTPVCRRLAASWKNVFAALEANCKKSFGAGTLTYQPELGETYFAFTA